MDKFDSSEEATAFVDELEAMLNDPRLLEWAKSTDQNFGTNAHSHLIHARRAVDEFVSQLDEAN
jgi:hypothetical protein